MKDISKIIEKLNNKIKNTFDNFDGIYLYGSYAKNTNTESSDIDIVALFKNTLNRTERMQLWTLISSIEGEFNVILDLHPMAKEELQKNPIYYKQVVNEGLFYGI